MGNVDVLVIAALQEEFEAARAEALVDNWEIAGRDSATPYLLGRYRRPDGSSISVAIARPTRMGANATGPLAGGLVERLRPACLAMCGVCAGHPDRLALGDVVVAEIAYQHDEGKLTQGGFVGDHRHHPMADTWVRAAQEMHVHDLSSYGEPTAEDADLWFLEQLLRGVQPNSHPARDRYLPGRSFGEAIARLEGQGLVRWVDATPALTEEGRRVIQRRLYTDVDGPTRLPFRVMVGPMASGNVVVADGEGWQRLIDLGVRSVLALDMEAAVIAATAHRLAVPHWLVVKGVMDHANPVKNDRFKRFAATASAQVLWRLLAQQLATRGPLPPGGGPDRLTVPRPAASGNETDFFISHAGADRGWAEWVAAQLRAAGFTVELDATDWRAGDNVFARMNDALKRCRAVIALWSRAYFDERSYALRELEAADLLGKRIIPLRLEEFEPEPIWRRLRSVDLFRGGEAQARAALAAAVGLPPSGLDPATPLPDPATQPRWPGVLPRVWNVPPPSVSFTGREALLGRLRELLGSGQRTAVHALSGLGGVGKTQLAVQYAYRESHLYDLVWWVNAEQPDLIAEQFASLALVAGLIDVNADIPTGEAIAREYLRTHDRWLVVLDNAPSAEAVARWVPQGGGHVIITSRSPTWIGVATPLSIDVFARAESIELLRSQLRSISEAEANELADKLGDLPLALAQAVGVMTETGMSARDYLRALAARSAAPGAAARTSVLGKGAPPDHQLSVLASVQLACDRLALLDPAAAALVRICAWLGPEPIPLWLFKPEAEQLPEELREAFRDDLRLRECIGQGARLGLLQTGADAVTMHRLTQWSLREGSYGADAQFPNLADELLVTAGLDDRDEPIEWTRMSLLLPHILARDPAQTDNDGLMYLALRVVWQLRDRGDAKAALPLAEDLYESWLERHGENHEDVLTAAYTLAAVYRALGDHAPARHLDRETFIRRRSVLGPDHPDTLASATSLAADLRGLGKFKLAQQHDQDTHARYLRLGDRYRAEALASAHNLARDLAGLGDVEGARALNEQTWAGRRELLGDNHPDTLASATNLADNLRAKGEYEQARRLDEQTLAGYRQALGDDHPSTLTSANNLAVDLRGLGAFEEARALDADTWARRKRVLGENHPYTLTSADNLVADLRALGREDEARRIEEETQVRRLGVIPEDSHE